MVSGGKKSWKSFKEMVGYLKRVKVLLDTTREGLLLTFLLRNSSKITGVFMDNGYTSRLQNFMAF